MPHINLDFRDDSIKADIANSLLCSALISNSRNRATNIYITGLLPCDFRETYKRNKIKRVNKLIREKCSAISTPQINYIEQDHDWIDEENCLRIKYYYRDCLHLVELGNNKLSNTIIKAIKHSNLTLSMNNNKYKATTVLTGGGFHLYQGFPLKHSVLKLYPLRLHTKIHCSPNLFTRHKIAAVTT